jgi:uncharacterized membrane protein YccC
MRLKDFEAALFALKCLIAALIAFYVAARVGLTRPYWAVATSYIVAQPLSGAVLSKAVYRLMGTLLGATAAVVLVPTFVNEPMGLSVALAVWLGLCVYLALLDRTSRSYVFLLAGYTASIIGFPSVDVPGTIFNTAAERVQEITIGILAGSIVHGAVFPRTVTARLLERTDAIVKDAQCWSIACLAGAGADATRLEQIRLTADIAELDQLAASLPFDTARVVPSGRAVRALQDQLSLLLPLASTVADRLRELGDSLGDLPARIATLVTRTAAWLADTSQAHQGRADELIAEARALEPAFEGEPIWREMLILSLLARVGELVRAHRDCRVLCEKIRNPDWREGLAELLAGHSPQRLHSDPGLALRAAAGTATTVVLGSSFWIATGWVDGGQAILMAGVCCSVFGNIDTPTPALFRFLGGFAVGLLAAAVYGFAILPRASDYVTVAAAIAPAFLVLGSMLARPGIARFSLGSLVAFPNTVGLYLNYEPDFHAFINTATAQLLGVAFATAMLGAYRTVDEAASMARIRRACFRDIVLRAEGRYDNTQQWLHRMLDRVSLLRAWRSDHSPFPANTTCDALVLHALKSLRIGYVAGELGTLGRTSTAAERSLIESALQGIGRHFSALDPVQPAAPAPELLMDIDRTVAAFALAGAPERRRQGLILLTSLRRNLFPGAPGYSAQSPG